MSTPTNTHICHFDISAQMLINIEDVNDNAPEFIYSNDDSVFGEFLFQSALDCSSHLLLRVKYSNIFLFCSSFYFLFFIVVVSESASKGTSVAGVTVSKNKNT